MSKEEVKPVDSNAALKELYTKFTAPFPDEALQVDNSRGFDLTSVKAQYIIERLNELVGWTNWRLEGEFEEKEDGGVLFQGKLLLFLGGVAKQANGEGMFHYIPTVGYSPKKKIVGDAYKGAKTDALSKAASYIGIANDVFKGKVKPPTKSAPKKEQEESTTPAPVKESPKIFKPASFQGKPAKSTSDF